MTNTVGFPSILFSTAAKCQTIFNQVSQTTAIPFKESCPNVHTRRLQTKKVKAVGKKLTSEIFVEQANAKADELKSQGALACLLAEEKKDIPWQSLILITFFVCNYCPGSLSK